MNKKISIAIPTFNRSRFLMANLKKIIPLCSELAIPIYVSDNASTDDTPIIIKTLMGEYEYLHFKSSDQNRGIDYNIDQVVRMSETEYCWLMSDDDTIDVDSIQFIAKVLDKESPDFMLLNCREMVIDSSVMLQERLYTLNSDIQEISKQTLLCDYPGIMTLLSACIVKTDLWRTIDLKDYKAKYYFHIYNVFHSIGESPKIIIVDRPLFTRYAGNKWQFEKSEIDFILHYFYPKTIELLPNTLSFKSKMSGIKHKLRRMKIGTFLRLRGDKVVTIKNFPKSYFYLMRLHLPLAIAALFLPPVFCNKLYSLVSKIIKK